MAKVNAQQYAEKQARNLKASTEDIKRGVEQVTEAPGIKAAKQQALMLQKLQEAVNSGKWARNVSKVSLEDWKKMMIDKGIGRIGAGIDAVQDKQVQMAEKLLAAVDRNVAKANATPRGDLQQNIRRMVTFVEGMAKEQIK